jgi:4-diphosphocytidyl-2C-methyl-D-erythritol 2-phosphate synthase
MDNSITEKSPAKINLFLKILNRREDNYNSIRTGITTINLCEK